MYDGDGSGVRKIRSSVPCGASRCRRADGFMNGGILERYITPVLRFFLWWAVLSLRWGVVVIAAAVVLRLFLRRCFSDVFAVVFAASFCWLSSAPSWSSSSSSAWESDESPSVGFSFLRFLVDCCMCVNFPSSRNSLSLILGSSSSSLMSRYLLLFWTIFG